MPDEPSPPSLLQRDENRRATTIRRVRHRRGDGDAYRDCRAASATAACDGWFVGTADGEVAQTSAAIVALAVMLMQLSQLVFGGSDQCGAELQPLVTVLLLLLTLIRRHARRCGGA